MRRLVITSVVLALSLGSGGTLAAEEEPSATGSFSPAGSLAEARTLHTATLLSDGRVLVAGGQNLGGILTSAEVWDPVTASFGPAGSLGEERQFHTATLLPDGRVLVVGGMYYNEEYALEAFASAEVWDPVTASFGPAGSLGEARWDHTATVLPDGRVLVVGGWDDHGGMAASSEVWNPATASFGLADSLAEARSGHTATRLPDGPILVVGGAYYNEDEDDVGLTSAEVWDPVTASFGPAGSLAEARWDHAATLLPDGRVLVIGGWGGDEPDPLLASAEVWDPATNTFSPAGSLVVARSGHTATRLPDGPILVVGGAYYNEDEDEDGHLASAEVWDPATGTFSPTGSLAEARRVHTATLLPDGRILIVGGWGDDDALASAEVWEPGSG